MASTAQHMTTILGGTNVERVEHVKGRVFNNNAHYLTEIDP